MESHEDKRPRVDKPAIIHDCVQSGDVIGLQKLLQDNPSLLNQRTAVMSETPLHASAGYNAAEILKLLLEWQGNIKVELEAKNMYGETPLHIAAKNGSNEAARLLLSHGALIEAKANNGMTPLHLSVWYSIRTEDCSIVKTLLENKADCNATDNVGMSPLDHLSKVPESGKCLHELLLAHHEEQRKRKALESCGEIKAKMDGLEKELSNIVGLHELKAQLRRWAKGMILDERRRALGLKVGTRKYLHMAFLGNPGTGNCLLINCIL